MLDGAALARMKPDAVLVNTSRGGVIDEDALVDALRTGGAAAGLDVFTVEPIPGDNPLLGLDNVVLTPHVIWYTVGTMRRYLEHAVDNCRRIRDGENWPTWLCGQRVGWLPTDRLIGKAPHNEV
jgi:phosphoglycerate dehydrogenase-like enzyme